MAEQLDRLKTALADRYAIERELGSGGMANVYLAHDLRHDREVAVKVLRPDLAAALGTERFLREIEVAANLTHPHILPVHDSGQADSFLYYVMHRDIKPENILLQSGHAVVADFGIARAITAAGGEKLTATGIAVGTPAYMSPEQGSGEQQ